MCVIKKFTNMEKTIIQPSAMPFIPYSPQCEKTPDKKLSRAEARRLGDLHAISMIDEGLKGEYISEEEFLKFLRQ